MFSLRFSGNGSAGFIGTATQTNPASRAHCLALASANAGVGGAISFRPRIASYLDHGLY